MYSIQIERRQGESALDFHRRLIYGKLVDKSLADVDYSELAEPLYGRQYASDVTRRMMYGSCRTLELMDSEGYSANRDGMAEQLDEKIAEMKRERQRLFDQRREYNKILNLEGRQDHLYDVLASAAEHLDESIGQLLSDGARLHSISGNEAVLVLSDWHYGMTASNVFNTYDTDTCKARVADIVEKASARLMMHGCEKLHIVVLGDLIHGAIHTGVRVASEELVCDQLMQASEILAQTVCRLSEYANETVVYMTYGNHARTVQNKNDSIHRDNMERIIPWWLEQRLRGCDNIHIQNDFENEFLTFDVCGHWFCASHGDLDSVRSSPRLLPTLFQRRYGKNIEYILLGDKHHVEEFEELGVTAKLCGALCGTDDYANDKRLYSTPSQLLLIVNREDGVDAEYKLKCE